MLNCLNYKDPIFLEDFNVVLDIDEDNVYSPIHYKDIDDSWCLISEGDIIYDWIVYVKIAFQLRDKVEGHSMVGNLYSYQWGWSIQSMLTLMDFGAKTLDVEWSRQSGKSYLLEHLVSFMSIYAPRYKKDLVGEKWTTITCSYKEKSAKKNFKGIRTKLKKAVDIYNKNYKSKKHELVCGDYKVGNESKRLQDTEDFFEIDVIQNKTSQGWSQVYALSTGTDQDGFSACLLYVDEAILVDAKEFYRSISPFGLANSACTIITGIASTDSSCLQYAVHYNDESIKSIYTWEDIYRLKKATSPDEAEKYKLSVLSEIQKNGGHNSTEVQTNFYMSWEVTDGKFTTREQLRKNNIFQTEIGRPHSEAEYIVAGLDLSTTNDYMVLTIMEVYKRKDNYKGYNREEDLYQWDCYVKDIITFNLDRQRMDSNIESKKIAKLLNDNKIDVVMVDSSGTQKAQVQDIYKAIQELNISTVLIPYDFGGWSNKANMMSNLEALMFSGRCKLPKESYKGDHASFDLLYEELLFLKKEKPKSGGRNIQYLAPSGKTDDHVMSLALASYALPRLFKMEKSKEWIEIGLSRFRAKFVKFTKTIKAEEYESPSFYYF